MAFQVLVFFFFFLQWEEETKHLLQKNPHILTPLNEPYLIGDCKV